METLLCNRCKKTKTASMFSKGHLRNGVRYQYYCQECNSQRSKEWAERIKATSKPEITHKLCSKCAQNLPASAFHNAATKDGLFPWCRSCKKEYKRVHTAKIAETPKSPITEKTCSGCKVNKPSSDFHKCFKTIDGLNYYCKSCQRAVRVKGLPKSRQTRRESLAKNPIRRLISNMRKRIGWAIQKQSKTAPSLKLLGCTGAECMDYLETLFWPGMTRDNQGHKGWAVDHIVALNSFDKTDPNWQFKAFHYTNIQPLWFDDNASKGDRPNWNPAESKHELPERLKTKIS